MRLPFEEKSSISFKKFLLMKRAVVPDDLRAVITSDVWIIKTAKGGEYTPPLAVNGYLNSSQLEKRTLQRGRAFFADFVSMKFISQAFNSSVVLTTASGFSASNSSAEAAPQETAQAAMPACLPQRMS